MRARFGGKTVQVGEMPEAGKMKVRRRDKRVWFVGLGVFAAVFLFTFLAGVFKSYDEEVEAASLANFDPGYIISDYQMGNYNSMSVAEIQAFLSSKNACNNTNIGMGVSRGYENYSDASGVNYNYWIDFGGSVGRYHVENGKFVCMANEKFNGKSAAEIIYEAAHDYKINPQVLLVLLQKEQGLITDDYPNHIQYRGATGYGCPDTAACSSKYYGLRNQVRNAAALFRTVLDGGWTNYPLGNNYIQYSPNAACGGSVVNIRSLATSALYRYTPYQPNAGALAAGYGTAYCGAYGNRNFYLYFSDWFEKPTTEINVAYDKVDYSGTYNVLYAGNHARAMTVSGDNVSVASFDKNNQAEQWRVTKTGEYYVIMNGSTGKVLDVSGGTFNNKNNVGQYRLNNSCAQQWNFVSNADGTITIHNVCSAKYVLDLADGDSNVQIYAKTSYENNHQKWILQPVGIVDVEDGDYYIYTADNKVVGTYNNAVTDGGNVLAEAFQNTDGSRHWTVARVAGENYYTIVNKNTNLALGISKNNVQNKTNVALCKIGDSSCAYFWYFEKYYDGGFFIRNVKAVTYVVDLQDGASNLQVYTKSKSQNSHQEWILVKESTKDYSGEYYILYSGNEAKALGVASDVVKANVATNWLTGGEKKQQWVVEKVEDYYYIKNKSSLKVLDVSGGAYANKTNIWQYGLNRDCAQRWQFVDAPNGRVLIRNACRPNFVLDLQDGDSNVQIYAKTSYENEHQLWVLVDATENDYSGNYYILYSGDEGKGLMTENDNVQVGADKQKWKVEKVDGYYVIKNLDTGKVVDVSGGTFNNKNNVGQYRLNNSCAQQWQFMKNSDGSVMIRSACYPNYVLDLQDGRVNVQIYTQTNYVNSHQRWMLRKI